MKVLIVNGFSDTPAGRRSFALYSTAVQEVMTRQAFTRQQMYSAENIEFLIVDHHSIDQYLSELNTGYLNTDSEKV
jgi:hypothetical protein